MKDNFSQQSKLYAQFRPTYPPELFQFLYFLVAEKIRAWDCGTGNGQMAAELASKFDRVYATDISEKQISNAVKKSNIEYRVERAEYTSFPSEYFDLITVAQAIHWFDFDRFYKEVDRVLKSDGIIAVIGYSLMSVDQEIDKVINHFYEEVIGSYWDPERKYIDENYQTIPFPYKEIDAPGFTIEVTWSFDELVGYLNTWSAVHHYIKKNGTNPVDEITDQLKASWGEVKNKKVTFPVLLRMGRKLA